MPDKPDEIPFCYPDPDDPKCLFFEIGSVLPILLDIIALNLGRGPAFGVLALQAWLDALPSRFHHSEVDSPSWFVRQLIVDMAEFKANYAELEALTHEINKAERTLKAHKSAKVN